MGRNPRQIMEEPEKTVSITETEEFRAAVNKALTEELPRKIEELLRSTQLPLPAADDRMSMESLALALGEMSSQNNTGRRYVDPKVLRQRKEGHDRLVQLIAKARSEGRVATYKLVNKALLDDEVVQPFWIDSAHVSRPTIIDWTGIPNLVMVPENETAKEIYEAFRDSIGEVEKVVPEEQLGVTRGGLVVHGRAVRPRMEVGSQLGDAGGKPEQVGGLKVHNKTNPGSNVQTRILGTLAAPATQHI